MLSVVMVACVRRALPRTGLPSPPPGDRLTSGSWQNHIKYSYIIYLSCVNTLKIVVINSSVFSSKSTSLCGLLCWWLGDTLLL